MSYLALDIETAYIIIMEYWPSHRFPTKKEAAAYKARPKEKETVPWLLIVGLLLLFAFDFIVLLAPYGILAWLGFEFL